MESIIYTALLIASFLFLVWKNNDTESYFPLKIIGYFILGSFAFKFNQISLPLGFVVFLLFFRPKLNAQVKHTAAIFGFSAFILVHWIIPFAIDEWKSRPIFIEHEIDSVYTINFQDEYGLIKKELELENNHLRLEDFKVDYTGDGRIADLSWQLLGHKGSSYSLYQIQYDFRKSRYRVSYSQHDTWLQYNRLIDADHFFETLNILDIKDITEAKGDFSYYVLQSSGERIIYGVEDRTHFVLSNEEVQLLDDDQLPVEGYHITAYAMKKTGEKRNNQGKIIHESFESTESSDFLFDVYFDKGSSIQAN